MKQLLTRLRWQLLLTGFLLLTAVLSAAAAETITIGDYTYRLNPETKTAIIQSINTPIQGPTYTIPSTVTVGETTYAITEINTLELPDLEELTIPASISQIGAMRKSNIKNMIFEDSETSISFIGASITVSESLYLGRDISQSSMIIYSGCANSVTIGECVNSFSWETIPSTKELIIKDSDKILYGSSHAPSSDKVALEKLHLGRNALLMRFSGMTNLTDVTFSEYVTELPIFNGCTSLESITLPSVLKTIEKSAFDGCVSLKTIQIPDNVEEIGGEAFMGCTSLTNVTMPSNLKEMADNLFNNCISLETIEIPSSVEKISNGVFSGCKNLKYIKLPSKLNLINESVFDGCESLETIIVPENVERIGSEAFSGCKNLKSIVLPSKLEYIARSLFEGCENLAAINLPAGVVEVLQSAFSGCSKLEEITFPAVTDWIDEEAFAGCTSLKRIRVMNPEPFDIFDNSFDKSTFATATLEVPAGTESAYAAADVWYKFLNLKEFTPPTLEIAETQVTVGVDNEITVTPIVKGAGEETFTFSFVSYDTEIADITPDGKIRGVSAGRTKILVLANGSKGTGLTTDFILTVTPKAGVEDIDADDETVTVFSMDGVECFRGNRSEIENRLSNGLYIVVGNGKATKKKL